MKRTVLGLALLLIFAGIAQAQTAVPRVQNYERRDYCLAANFLETCQTSMTALRVFGIIGLVFCLALSAFVGRSVPFLVVRVDG